MCVCVRVNLCTQKSEKISLHNSWTGMCFVSRMPGRNKPAHRTKNATVSSAPSPFPIRATVCDPGSETEHRALRVSPATSTCRTFLIHLLQSNAHVEENRQDSDLCIHFHTRLFCSYDYIITEPLSKTHR